MRVACLNAGSSSLKAAFFAVDDDAEPVRVASHNVERVAGDYAAALARVPDELAPDVVAHRFVHGGPDLVEHAVIDDRVRGALEAAMPLAPLHLPAALAVLGAAEQRWPDVLNVACFDTAFHRNLLPATRRLPIPEELDADGVRRYGFHGLSYEYLVHSVGTALGSRAVLAHLGNGSSLAAVREGIGVDTTMGFTPAGGLVMGTRTGDIDPGALIYILRARGVDADELEQIVDRQSGLLGLAGSSSDVRDLLAAREHGDERATLALDIYESVAAKHIAALTTVLGGLDTLVFTAGIGEHSAPIRAGIAARLAHLGVMVDADLNDAHAAIISAVGAPVTVRVEPTDEEVMMARHAVALISRRRV
jgi:acetate kinase